MPNVRGRGAHAVSLVAAHARGALGIEEQRRILVRGIRHEELDGVLLVLDAEREVEERARRDVPERGGVVDVEVGSAAAFVGERSLHMRLESAQREHVARDHIALEVGGDRQRGPLRRLDASRRRRSRAVVVSSARCRNTLPRATAAGCRSRSQSSCISVPMISASGPFSTCVMPFAPWKETWMSSHSSRNTAPLNCRRSSAKRVFQPSS